MTEHWLQHAHGRIVAGDDELEVLADYGWVQITADEREAVARLRNESYCKSDENCTNADMIRLTAEKRGRFFSLWQSTATIPRLVVTPPRSASYWRGWHD